MLLKNKARCKNCGDIIESKSVHDFKWCKCKSIFVDGGLEYQRWGGVLAYFEDLSVYGKYKKGDILCTRDGRSVGNAIIVSDSAVGTSGIKAFVIETDFGNTMFLTSNEIAQYFHSPTRNLKYVEWKSQKIYKNKHYNDGTKPETERCPRCKADMVVRMGRFGEFWGCTNFPNCRGTKQYGDNNAFQNMMDELWETEGFGCDDSWGDQ